MEIKVKIRGKKGKVKNLKLKKKSTLIEFSLSLSKNADRGAFIPKMTMRKSRKSHTCRLP